MHTLRVIGMYAMCLMSGFMQHLDQCIWDCILMVKKRMIVRV